MDTLASEPSLRGYYLLPAVCADLLLRLGRNAQARREVERAASLTQNLKERELQLQRARAYGAGDAASSERNPLPWT